VTRHDAPVKGNQGAAAPRFPLAPAQRPFWFAEFARPGTPANNISVRWELRGPIRSAQIEAAFHAVIARHEILRTRFLDDEGTPVQEVVQDTQFRLSILDIRNIPAASQEARIDQFESELGADGFDLASPCPMRIALVQLAPDRAALLIVVHHIIFDGFSIRVLGEEIGSFLAAEATGADWTPPGIELQYGDYSLWREACLESPEHLEDRAYWRDRLRDAPYFELPPDRARGSFRILRGARLTQRFGSGFERRLEAAAQRHGVSAFTIGAAAVSAALHRLTGAHEILLGTPVAGRQERELEPLIGAFINTVVLRLPIDPSRRLDALVDDCGRAVAGALAHQSLSFDEAVHLAGQRRDPARTPLVSILFGLQRVFLQERQYGPFEIRSVPSQAPGLIYDLDIQIFGRNSGWTLTIDYNAELYSAETVATLANTVTAALDALLDGAEYPVSAIPAFERGAVPEPPSATPAEDEADDDMRADIAAIWAELLDLPAEACNGDFFDLGGHSVLALRMLAKVERRFGVRPGLSEFFAAPTLSGFASTVSRQLEAPEETGAEDGLWKMIWLRDGPKSGLAVVSLNQPFLYHNVARAFEMDAPVVNLHVATPGRARGSRRALLRQGDRRSRRPRARRVPRAASVPCWAVRRRPDRPKPCEAPCRRGRDGCRCRHDRQLGA
jgi:hypothetical protein